MSFKAGALFNAAPNPPDKPAEIAASFKACLYCSGSPVVKSAFELPSPIKPPKAVAPLVVAAAGPAIAAVPTPPAKLAPKAVLGFAAAPSSLYLLAISLKERYFSKNGTFSISRGKSEAPLIPKTCSANILFSQS